MRHRLRAICPVCDQVKSAKRAPFADTLALYNHAELPIPLDGAGRPRPRRCAGSGQVVVGASALVSA